MASINVMFPFRMVPVTEELEYIEELFPVGIMPLFCDVLTTAYLKYDDLFYGQTDGVTLESLLSSVVTNFYTDKFEQTALQTALKKLSHEDNTFVVRNHGEGGNYTPYIIKKRARGRVCRKSTHTYRHLHKESNHNPGQKSGGHEDSV